MITPSRWAGLSVRDVIAEPGDDLTSDRLQPFANHATPPVLAEAGHVVISLLTGEGVPVLASFPATHRLLPYVLSRKGTRIRDLAADVTLPAPDKTAPAPLPDSYETGRLPYRFRRIRLLPTHSAYSQETHA